MSCGDVLLEHSGVAAEGVDEEVGGEEGKTKKRLRVTEEVVEAPEEEAKQAAQPKEGEEADVRECLLALLRAEEGLGEAVARLVERVREALGFEQGQDAAAEKSLKGFRAWFWAEVLKDGVFRWSSACAVTADGLARSVAEALSRRRVRDALFGNIEAEVAAGLGMPCASGAWALEAEDWRALLRVEVVLAALAEWEKWLFDEAFDEFACRGCVWVPDRRSVVFTQCRSKPIERFGSASGIASACPMENGSRQRIHPCRALF